MPWIRQWIHNAINDNKAWVVIFFQKLNTMWVNYKVTCIDHRVKNIIQLVLKYNYVCSQNLDMTNIGYAINNKY